MMGSMRLISQGKAEPVPEPPFDDDLDRGLSTWLRYRRLALRILVPAFVLAPALGLLVKQGFTGDAVFLVPAAAVFAVLCERSFLLNAREPGWQPPLLWPWVVVLTGLALAMFAVGQMGWLTPMAFAAAIVGRFVYNNRLAAVCVLGLAAATVVIAEWQQLNTANVVISGALVVLAALLSGSAERRNILVYRLKETRAELARAAVAEERLRISRDLHDLLGHSLSLIALKAELAGRMISKDPDRAAREIADVETVARRSLTEVRQAVTGYRQPSLAAELISSRRMLASAGIDCRVQAPGAYSLPSAVDALLAWTVREGATNIVRHAAAKHAEIVIEVTDTVASACLSDDGMGLSADGAAPGETATIGPDAGAGADPGPAPAAGSGLAGLAERAARLGGTMSAGAGQNGGFRLQVSVPLTAPPELTAPAGEPADAEAIEPADKRVPS